MIAFYIWKKKEKLKIPRIIIYTGIPQIIVWHLCASQMIKIFLTYWIFISLADGVDWFITLPPAKKKKKNLGESPAKNTIHTLDIP